MQVRRLGNATTSGSTTTGCTDVPYTLSNDPSSARFLKPLDQQPTAQFVADFVWTLPYTATSTTLPATTLDFETPGTGSPATTGPRTLGWCPNPSYDGTITKIIDPGTPSVPDDDRTVTVPQLVGIANPLGQTDMDEYPGVQFACVGSQSVQVVNTSASGLRVIEQVYVLGDAAWYK